MNVCPHSRLAFWKIRCIAPRHWAVLSLSIVLRFLASVICGQIIGWPFISKGSRKEYAFCVGSLLATSARSHWEHMMFRLPRPQNLGVIQNSYYLKIEKESVAGPAFSASVGFFSSRCCALDERMERIDRHSACHSYNTHFINLFSYCYTIERKHRGRVG